MNYTNVSGDPFEYSYHCHEGTLAFAYALNLTIAGEVYESCLIGTHVTESPRVSALYIVFVSPKNAITKDNHSNDSEVLHKQTAC